MNTLVVHPKGHFRLPHVSRCALALPPRVPVQADARRIPVAGLCATFPLIAGRARTRRSATAESRNQALQFELLKHGITFEDLDRPPHDPLLYPAVRCCKAFVCPSNKHALEVACRPGRAVQVANDVARLVRDAQKASAAWTERKEAQKNIQDTERITFKPLTPPLILVLDCIRSTRNVGSLLRSCALVGASVVFCGITPAPPMPAVLKSAGEAAALVPSSFAVSGKDAVLRLQREGFQVWALETTSHAKELETTEFPDGPLALVLGHESYGVSASALKACDEHVCITTVGIKNSLNVAVAGSIALFEVAEQRSQ
ncbi:unnamed protein product [Durusdinium trenchii]|uniref:tRNA/rRNA methyltransferase SpoU type domain-containing protein n=1 Tax=Durusdinium trenchii TaxID=1381693 RepID=A0ABP0LWK0_9DINO